MIKDARLNKRDLSVVLLDLANMLLEQCRVFLS